MNETTNTTAHTRPEIPRKKLWIIAFLLTIASFGMYAGTMYRIQNYGYVGLGADQPIAPGAKLNDDAK